MFTLDSISDQMGGAIQLVLLISAVIILPGLVVGLCVSIFQAATQINEQTLSFLPRLVVTLLVLIVAGKWILIKLIDFTELLFHQAGSLTG
ncbi:flagellar biosynthesis protein FliQ [Rosenbergiella epipactidis]|uniref:flagellar biosynthesis protein FliQ n=1 Tax=Erwiniaceae TaxID=1903409 RepID=UPI0006647BCA|nr:MULTISPECIES: flagellar biosynthesis protein FliQ [Erwiniaceae]KMV74274.1 flagellar biosynthesis protein FliQ [bacteria symbiont BFo2 of Frankliniella occidentalis]KYP87265.1 flagellar biosynthesis protein FliQ [bacteria symbiont BFo2 of Frankliniella occidentalis]KYP95024.1 flagellar biosynthesis protein FliQ [bacteria symbiont BFo2 of Frankliniella occidentalis]MBT0718872.1 flagellar biosynthesis protein FliQ [Rosenbergiella epipactidis]MCL9668880.1 flagellar biosynthesis protein FliQ [Ro